MNKMSKTTKNQFEIFKTECKKWLKYFGLNGWRVEYQHEKHNDARACIAWKMTDRVATITLSTEWEGWRDTPITNRDIDKVAFHEVCELFLSRITMMADGKISNHCDAVEEETHNIIRTLENTIFMDKK